MIITFHGISCFRIASKTASGPDRALVMNPYDSKDAGIKLPHLKADVVLLSSSDPLHSFASGVKPQSDADVFSINSPGEYEVKDMYVHALATSEAEVIFFIEIEGVKIVFLGGLSQPSLSDGLIEVLENLDVLILPIGGGSVLSAKHASGLVNQLEPRIVIPMYYPQKGLKLKKLTDTPSMFYKELGVTVDDPVDKFKLTAKELPQEELLVLEFKS